jgi:hypothetical protein
VKEWFPANKDSLRPTDGKLSAAGLASAMGSAWGALTQTAKDEYAAKAKELKKAFDVEYKKWYARDDQGHREGQREEGLPPRRKGRVQERASGQAGEPRKTPLGLLRVPQGVQGEGGEEPPGHQGGREEGG